MSSAAVAMNEAPQVAQFTGKNAKITTALSPDALIERLTSLLEANNHANQPIVRKIAAGTATREQITRFGIFFANFTRITPNVFGSVYARCYDHAMRRKILDNIIDEDTELRCGDKSHYDLAVDFVTRFAGISENEVINYPFPFPIRDINNFRLRVAQNLPIGEAMCVFGIAGEAHFSGACSLISDGLREHYGVKDEDQASWIVHIEGDEDHREVAEYLVKSMVTTAESQASCMRLVAEYLDRWQYFYGLCDDPDFRLTRSALEELNRAE